VELIRFALLGLGTGAVYAMLAQGLVVVYRGSGLINFAQGAVAMTGAYIYYESTVRRGLPELAALAIAVLGCAVLGVLIQLLLLRPMRASSPLSRVIATLGVMACLQSIAFLRYGSDPLPVPSVLSTRTVSVFTPRLSIGLDTLTILGIGVVITIALTMCYRYTALGRLTSAVAEDELVASSLGHSPHLIASANWALASALAGLGGVLIAPITFLEPTGLVLLVVPALAAALLGKFLSFPVTFGLALLLGIAASELSRFVSQPGWATAAPFVAVVAILTARGQVLPLRGFVSDSPPIVGSGRIRPGVLLVVVAVGSYVTLTSDPVWASALITTIALSVICLSVVVITGYAGQLSLAQSVLAGFGAMVAAQSSDHVPFGAAVVIGALAAGAVGGLVGIPALRTRGVTLAIATLGLSAAVFAVVLSNPSYNGGFEGVRVHAPMILGWDIDPLFHGSRYAFVVFVALVLSALAVANLRRGATGRRLLALRSNERAAAALGVPGPQLKAYAFILSATLAGLGGVLLAFGQPTVQVSTVSYFAVFGGITLVSVCVVGGVGFVGGAVLGALLIPGGVISQLFHEWPAVNDYLPLIGGVALVLVLLTQPDGMSEANRQAILRLRTAIGRRDPAGTARRAPGSRPYGLLEGREVMPELLTVTGLTVSFGGVAAVRDVTLQVRPGEIHGLIGPNGAGKTTIIDAMTGFVRAQRGQVSIGEADISPWSARRRAKVGMSRSFQSLELFDDLTVLENLAVASEHPGALRCLLDLIWPGRINLTRVAVEAIEEFGLDEILDRQPNEISFGQRKSVAIARAMASAPCVLLLDEPAAGLDDVETAELASLIRRIVREWGIGVLLVEHKIDMVMSICDRITVLEQGQVLTTGEPAAVIEDRAVVDAYLGVGTHA
jgi:ABC-type branched-subunit amino acid transport system ATPase component/branched-subunit amino acid ABC-type transport system permease component